MPDLRQEIAQCKRHGQMHDACMVRYVDLALANSAACLFSRRSPIARMAGPEQ
jgi:hypothetical protein